jgi:hypothetical protein
VIDAMGGVVSEGHLLEELAKDESTRNHIHFLLVLGVPFKKKKEDEHFHHRWYVDEETAKRVEESIKKLYSNLTDTDLVPESEMIANFLEHTKELSEKYRNEEIAKRWLILRINISQKIPRTPRPLWHSISFSLRFAFTLRTLHIHPF